MASRVSHPYLDIAAGTVELLAASSDISAVSALAWQGPHLRGLRRLHLGLSVRPPAPTDFAEAAHRLAPAVYNSLAGPVTDIAATIYNVEFLVAFFGFVIVYDSIFGLLLLKRFAPIGGVHSCSRGPGRDRASPGTDRVRPLSKLFDVLCDHVDLQMYRIADRLLRQRRLGVRRRDDRHIELFGATVGDGETDAVDCYRPFMNQVVPTGLG